MPTVDENIDNLPLLASAAREGLLDTPDFQPAPRHIIKDLVNWLRKLRKGDETALQILDYLYMAETHFKTNSVQFLQTQTGTDYYELVKVLKVLNANGFGKFIVGRKGKDSRMTWRFDPQSMGAAANFKAEDLPLPAIDMEDYDGGAPDEGNTKHAFRLRPDYDLNIVLPSDFNRGDAHRLSRWLESLPFD